jgi:hypothetical protein
MKKIISTMIILLFFNLTSCQDKQNGNKKKNDRNIKDNFSLDGHTFLKVTDTDSGKVLFQPCGASIESYKFYKDSLYHNWGQESDLINKISLSRNNNGYFLKGFNINTNKSEEFDIEKLKGELFYFKINNKIFIDSLFIKKISQRKETCVTDEENFDVDIVSSKSWSNDCKLDEAYIYFTSIGGQFVCRNKFSFDTKLKKSSNNEFNILFDNTFLKKPYPSSMEDYQNFSATNSIAKIKKNGNVLEFTWFGFYNTKTKKREFLENPFTGKIEQSPIILKECDE